MSMKVNTNVSALFSARQLSMNETAMGRAMERLSSGLRINSARDDAAGLAISERLTTQIRGLNQAARNTNDGISMLQTADGAMSTAVNSLQRIRELAVQAANGGNGVSDREALQKEAQQLVNEINRIGTSATFNNEKIFAQTSQSVLGDSDQLAVLDGLQSGWLQQAEDMISEYFGITGDGAEISIELTSFSDGSGNTAARVVGSVPGSYTGKATNIKLQIDMEDFKPPNLPNGGTAPFYNDRIIAHEMVHAVMYRSMNIGSLANPANDQTWFLEGAAEFIHGADERLASSIASVGVGGVMTRAGTFGSGAGSWGGSSDDYSAAYAAVRYLHQEIKDSGGEGIKDVMTHLTNNLSDTLEDAIAAVTDYADLDAFHTDFNANGAAFISGLDLTNADTGAIGGKDADGGAVRTAENIIPNRAGRSGEDQLVGFAENWEVIDTTDALQEKQFQVGSNVGEKTTTSLGALSSKALDLEGLDLVNNFNQAIFKMDRALEYVSEKRAEIGAQLNTFESTIANLQTNAESLTASRSRIMDADFAQETAKLTRQQVLQQAATAMVSQANSAPQIVLALMA